MSIFDPFQPYYYYSRSYGVVPKGDNPAHKKKTLDCPAPTYQVYKFDFDAEPKNRNIKNLAGSPFPTPPHFASFGPFWHHTTRFIPVQLEWNCKLGVRGRGVFWGKISGWLAASLATSPWLFSAADLSGRWPLPSRRQRGRRQAGRRRRGRSLQSEGRRGEEKHLCDKNQVKHLHHFPSTNAIQTKDNKKLA